MIQFTFSFDTPDTDVARLGAFLAEWGAVKTIVDCCVMGDELFYPKHPGDHSFRGVLSFHDADVRTQDAYSWLERTDRASLRHTVDDGLCPDGTVVISLDFDWGYEAGVWPEVPTDLQVLAEMMERARESALAIVDGCSFVDDDDEWVSEPLEEDDCSLDEFHIAAAYLLAMRQADVRRVDDSIEVRIQDGYEMLPIDFERAAARRHIAMVDPLVVMRALTYADHWVNIDLNSMCSRPHADRTLLRLPSAMDERTVVDYDAGIAAVDYLVGRNRITLSTDPVHGRLLRLVPQPVTVIVLDPDAAEPLWPAVAATT